MIDINPFGKIIKDQRLHKKLPLRKVAAYIDIDQSTLSKIERSERLAARNLIKPLSEILELDYKRLLTAYFSDQIADVIYKESDCSSILQVAEKKVIYKKELNK